MIEFRCGDVRKLLAELPAGSVDLVATSWPYLAQRSYLPKDHPMKAKEIGQESTPAEFIQTLLAKPQPEPPAPEHTQEAML